MSVRWEAVVVILRSQAIFFDVPAVVVGWL